MFLFIRLSTSPRGAALGRSAASWLLCALVLAWLCLSSSLVHAASLNAVSTEVSSSQVSSSELNGVEASGAGGTATTGAIPSSAAAPAGAGVPAGAGAAEEGAPMCDPHGASIVAQPEIPEIDHGKLEQLPCDDTWLRWLDSTLEHARSQAAARDGVPATPPTDLQLTRVRADGLVPLVIVMPERGQPQRLPRSEVAGLAARLGHRFSVYRPPVRGR